MPHSSFNQSKLGRFLHSARPPLSARPSPRTHRLQLVHAPLLGYQRCGKRVALARAGRQLRRQRLGLGTRRVVLAQRLCVGTWEAVPSQGAGRGERFGLCARGATLAQRL